MFLLLSSLIFAGESFLLAPVEADPCVCPPWVEHGTNLEWGEHTGSPLRFESMETEEIIGTEDRTATVAAASCSSYMDILRL